MSTRPLLPGSTVSTRSRHEASGLSVREFAEAAGGDANAWLIHAASKDDKEGVRLCLDEGANADGALDYAIADKDLRLFTDLLTRAGGSAAVWSNTRVYVK